MPDLILLQNMVSVLTTRNCIVYRLVWLNVIPEEGRRVTICWGGKTNNVCICMKCLCGPGSSVGIATDYGLDGPGSNPGGDKIFRPFRPALGPKVRPGRAADHSPLSSAAVMEE